MRNFYIFRAAGNQQRGFLRITKAATKAASISEVRTLNIGEYTVRDALGGLRGRLKKLANGTVTVMEWTR